MTDKERYRQAFDSLRAPDGLRESILDSIKSEDYKMTENKKKSGFGKKTMIILAAAALMAVFAGSAYAANVGGIQRTVQLWFHGDQTSAVLEIDNADPDAPASYTVHYTDENGNDVEQQGGGMAVDMFGRERPLTEEEIMEHLMEPDVVFNDDGTVFVYSLDQSIDITDKFDEDGFCFVTVTGNKGRTYYLTINKSGHWGYSTTRYMQPSEFND